MNNGRILGHGKMDIPSHILEEMIRTASMVCNRQKVAQIAILKRHKLVIHDHRQSSAQYVHVMRKGNRRAATQAFRELRKQFDLPVRIEVLQDDADIIHLFAIEGLADLDLTLEVREGDEGTPAFFIRKFCSDPDPVQVVEVMGRCFVRKSDMNAKRVALRRALREHKDVPLDEIASVRHLCTAGASTSVKGIERSLESWLAERGRQVAQA